MQTYDAVVVLGTGIKPDGTLVKSSQAAVEKAVELIKTNKASYLILSGKWAWSIDYTPPTTEAEAMANYAKSLGCPDKKIVIETNSVTTVSTLCMVKTKILMKSNWNRIILISNYPYKKRALLNSKVVLGPKFTVKIVSSGFSYPDDILNKLKKTEIGKLKDAKDFYQGIKAGDHESIYKLAMKDLEKNYMTKTRK